MTLPMQMTRRSLLSLVPAAGASLFAGQASGAAPRSSERLEPRLENGLIRVAAPDLRFVSGAPLERLRNGAPVPFALQLALSSDRFATVLQRDIERFVLSYDLWEEKFAVTRFGRPRRTASHLTDRTAEAWCIAQTGVPPAGMADSQPFWLRLEARAESPAEETETEGDGAMSLTRLVELFSRRGRSDPSHFSVEAGPFRLASLKKVRAEVLR